MTEQQPFRALAVAPTSQKFGFAVVEADSLIDWGLKAVSGDKHVDCLKKVESFIMLYRPDMLVLEDFTRTRRGPRIRFLIQCIVDMAPKHNVGVKLFSRKQVYAAFFADGRGTKETLAALLAERFPDELGPKLPPKRETWDSEDARLAIFDAVATGLVAIRYRGKNARPANNEG